MFIAVSLAQVGCVRKCLRRPQDHWQVIKQHSASAKALRRANLPGESINLWPGLRPREALGECSPGGDSSLIDENKAATWARPGPQGETAN